MDCDEGDSCDEIIAAITGKSTPHATKDTYGTPCPQSKGPPLLRHLEWKPNVHVDPSEERELIRRLQAGDDAAGTILVRGRIAWLKDQCGQNKYSALPFDERFSVAATALGVAYAKFDLKRNNGLTAFITKAVNGAICDAITDHSYNGIKNESRDARKDRSAHRPIHAGYNGVEGTNHDGDGGEEKMASSNPGWVASDDNELRECDGSGGKVTDQAWKRIKAWRRIATGPEYPGTTLADYPLSPLKTISRERYATDQATAHASDTAAHVQQRLTRRLRIIGRNLGVPPECLGVDENPRRNGGRAPTKLQRDTLRDFTTTKILKFKDGKKRSVICQYGGRVTLNGQRMLHGKDYPPLKRCDNPLPLREYLKANPTPKKDKAEAPIRGNASPLGIIGYLAKDADRRAIRRLKQVGRVSYAAQLAAKDRNTIEKRPLQRHLYETPLEHHLYRPKSKPTQLWPKSVLTEAMLAHTRAKLAHPIAKPQFIERAQVNKPKLRIIEGLKHGKFNQPGPLDHVVHGNAHDRARGGDTGDIRPRHRAER